MQRDPALAGQRFGYCEVMRAAQRRRVPGMELISAIPRFLRPGYHPVHEATSALARAFLATRFDG